MLSLVCIEPDKMSNIFDVTYNPSDPFQFKTRPVHLGASYLNNSLTFNYAVDPIFYVEGEHLEFSFTCIVRSLGKVIQIR